MAIGFYLFLLALCVVTIQQFSDQNKQLLCYLIIRYFAIQIMSKIFLFGGTGQCGKAFLKLVASNETIQIIASTRNMQKVEKEKLKYKNVEWIKANPFQSQTYESRLSQCNFVISFLGTEDTKNVNIYSAALPAVLKAMENKNVPKLIAVTSAYQESQKNFFFRNFVKKVFLSNVLADQQKFQTWIRKQYKGNVNFTILKPFRLGDEGGKKTKSQRYRAQKMQVQKVKWQLKTDIYDIAQQILNLREKDLYPNQFIILGYTDK